MVFCLLALGAFAVLGIFSAKYRTYFFEALDCVLKKATLRKCTTSFDQKMKAKISARATQFNKPLGAFVFKNFETLSWILTIVMIVSILWTGYLAFTGLYNWAAYGNCNGPNSSVACELNALTGQAPSKPLLVQIFGDANAATTARSVDANIDCDTNAAPNSLPQGVQ